MWQLKRQKITAQISRFKHMSILYYIQGEHKLQQETTLWNMSILKCKFASIQYLLNYKFSNEMFIFTSIRFHKMASPQKTTSIKVKMTGEGVRRGNPDNYYSVWACNNTWYGDSKYTWDCSGDQRFVGRQVLQVSGCGTPQN